MIEFQFYWPSWYKWWRISYSRSQAGPFTYSKFLCIGPLQWHWYGA